MTVGDVDRSEICGLLTSYGLSLVVVVDGSKIPGSYWGEPEAGVIACDVFVRSDTPVHSLLHETAHIACMSEARRKRLMCDAGGDDDEESAVCYLQVALADQISGAGRDRILRDMDTWGYTFRLGSAARWFHEDASDARDWLVTRGLLTRAGQPTFALRA